MARQRESLLVGDPFDVTLHSYGWYTINTHGNQFQEGLPDRYIAHFKYKPRWIEYKVFDDQWHIHLTRAQKIKFPALLERGVLIYIIASKDLRGEKHFSERERLYKKLFKEPNGHYALTSITHKLLR